MVKVDIISGFLGAGKTTLIKNLFKSSMKNEKVVLIENEFGEIGVDGTFLKESGVEIKEINSGCICCSLVGDFSSSMKEVVDKFNPDRIIIEPSGVGRLSDIIKAVEKVDEDLKINIVATVVDGGKCKMYHKNFGEFYNDQIAQAKTVIVSKTENLSETKINDALAIIRELNPDVTVITTPVSELDPEQVLGTLQSDKRGYDELLKSLLDEEEHEHHHHDEDDDEHEHHHHDHEDHEHGHHHHHHDHDHDHEGGEVEEYGIGTFVYYRRKAFDLGLFDEFVARKWPRDIVRAKGICYFADEPDMCYVFEQAGQQKTVKQAGQWLATMPADQLAELRKNNPQLEKEWDEKLGDRMIKIVFIGQHIKDQKDAIIAELDKTLAL